MTPQRVCGEGAGALWIAGWPRAELTSGSPEASRKRNARRRGAREKWIGSVGDRVCLGMVGGAKAGEGQRREGAGIAVVLAGRASGELQAGPRRGR